VTARRGPAPEKAELRDRLLVRRRTRPLPERSADGAALARRLVDAPELADARTVAAYVSLGTEPPTDPLLRALRERGTGVVLPVLLPDLDLAWAEYTGPECLAPGPRGMRQPGGPRLGPHTVGSVDVVLCPGLAVDRRGVRLGRGGGSYDRALARVPAGVWTCVLLYDDEVLDDPLPAEGHDQRVCAAATPSGIVRFA
jgi:5-formyltetrahydrofolate cyclo-ligase